MSAPVSYGGVGVRGNGLGQLGLGGPQFPMPVSFPAMPPLAGSFIAHLFSNAMAFKKTLGGAASIGSMISKPGLKATLMSGFHPVTLELSTIDSAISLGDIIRLTEQGDNSGTVLFSGIVEEIPDEFGPGVASHTLTVTPLIAELGDTPFSRNYTTPTDVSQMVRDAVATTTHCGFTPASIGDSGVPGVYDFSNSHVLEVLNIAEQIAGAQWFWHCDARGKVWFQPATTRPVIILKRGSDYNSRKAVPSIQNRKNHILVIGGIPAGASAPITSLYHNATSITNYGFRALDPPVSVPACTDQATLDKIATSWGATLDRIITTIEITLPAYPSRLNLGWGGGLTVGLREPSGAYAGPWVVQDIEADAPTQKLILADVPIVGLLS